MFYLLIGIVIAVSFNDTFRERLAQNCRGSNDLRYLTRIAMEINASLCG
jgi:hypothetical protein